MKRDENLVDIETDKVVLETPAPDSGVLVKIVKGDGGTVVGKEIIATIDTEAKAGRGRAAPRRCASCRSASRGGRPVMPAAQKIAADNKIDAGSLAGSGRGGRVTKGDVLDAVQGAPATAAPAPATRRRARPHPQLIWARSASVRSNGCRCHVCARASPSVSCSRNRPRPY